MGPVRESPLAFVDAQSVDEADLVPVHLDGCSRPQSSFYALQFNPGMSMFYGISCLPALGALS